jgi:uncharacterized protein
MKKSRAMLAAALVLLTFACVFLVGVWAGQRRLIYYPTRELLAPAEAGLSGVEDVTFSAADTPTLHGWFLPSASGRGPFTFVVFNGNAGNRSYRGDLAKALHAAGHAVLLFDYRGYGENDGAPTEAGLAADARAARAFLIARADVDATRLVYFGESLGSAVATRLAAEHPPAAIVLRSPFNTIVEVGRVHFPWLPVAWLLRDRFAPAEHIQRIRCPLLVIAGDRDTIVPFSQSQRLFDAALEPKTLAVIKGADHNDEALLAGREMIGAIERFLRDIH